MSTSTALTPGSVWWVESWVLSGSDVKDGRPVVIVQGPRHGLAIVIVWARTSNVTERGIFTPARVLTGLSKDGVISPRYQHSIDVAKLREPTCHYLGTLPEPYLTQVVAMWENS